MRLIRLNIIIIGILTVGIFVQSCSDNQSNTSPQFLKSQQDSIDIWIKASKNRSNPISERKQLLEKAYGLIKSNKKDSLKARKLSELAYQHLKLKDTFNFKRLNTEALVIAEKIKDTFALADAHWNYASYYNNKQVYDSAYYHFYTAQNLFENNGNTFESARTQFGMAFVKGRFKDYSGSEVLVIKAIQKYKKIKNYKSLFACYDYLGQLQKGIKEYERALFYYDKSLGYAKKLDNSRALIEANLNNVANIYVEQKEYTKALENYNKILSNKYLKAQDALSYARVIDNKAYCKLLMQDTTAVYKPLKEALTIRDSMNSKDGMLISKMHFANYYAYIQDTTLAIKFAREANQLAKETKNGAEYLKTFSLLAKLDPQESDFYLNRYIQINDSLQLLERKTQNKFLRIEYETDEYIEENRRLAEQKIWFMSSGLALLLIIGLFYFYNRQKSRSERLELENEQQAANEQVYLLTLRQQEKLEKEKVKERNRIAEELHDGILGKLFGTRVGLGFLDIKADKNTKEQHQLFLEELQTIEQEIREVSHKLSDNFDSSQLSFSAIINQLLENKSKIGKFEYTLEFDEGIGWQRIDEKIRVNLYRIIQEATQNSIKHALAKNISISFKLKANFLELTIKDDGLGFKVKQRNKGIGIKNMKSRVEKLNGKIEIYSILKKGTTITVQIPVKK